LEIELKLLLPPERLQTVPDLELLRPLTLGAPHVERLHTRYYDTPACVLAGAGVALRIRRAGEAWIQTLKGGGRSAGGLHERFEREWRLAQPELDLAVLADTPYAQLFADAALRASLQPVFETEFERTALQLRFPDGTRAELALDRGEVRAGGKSEPISEIEIELIEGDADRLYELALALCERLPVRLGHVSKAERGNALASGRVRPPARFDARLEADMTAAQALGRLGLACLVQLQANEEGVLAGADAQYLHQYRLALRRLRRVMALFRFVVPHSVHGAPVLRRLAAAVERAHEAGQCEDLRALIQDSRYAATLLRLARRFGRPEGVVTPRRIAPDTPATVLAAAVLGHCDRKLREAGADARRLHAGKADDALAFFGTLYPEARVRAYAEALEALKDAPGPLAEQAFLRAQPFWA